MGGEAIFFLKYPLISFPFLTSFVIPLPISNSKPKTPDRYPHPTVTSISIKYFWTHCIPNNWPQQAVLMLGSSSKQNMHSASWATMTFLNPFNIEMIRGSETGATEPFKSHSDSVGFGLRGWLMKWEERKEGKVLWIPFSSPNTFSSHSFPKKLPQISFSSTCRTLSYSIPISFFKNPSTIFPNHLSHSILTRIPNSISKSLSHLKTQIPKAPGWSPRGRA